VAREVRNREKQKGRRKKVEEKQRTGTNRNLPRNLVQLDRSQKGRIMVKKEKVLFRSGARLGRKKGLKKGGNQNRCSREGG